MAEHVAKTEGKIKGIPANIVTAFNALEPYKGGKGHELWVLNELNNLSKHRELIAVGGKFQDIDIASHFSELVRRRFGRAAITRDPDEGIPIFVKPAYALCPLKDGDVLFTDAPNAEPNPKLHFRFNVSLNEPQIVHAQPLIETVDRLFQLVSQIVSDFSSEV